MSPFLITDGPDPQVCCEACAGVARMAQYFLHAPRPADFETVKRIHVCGPGPWDVAADPEPDEVATGTVP